MLSVPVAFIHNGIVDETFPAGRLSQMTTPDSRVPQLELGGAGSMIGKHHPSTVNVMHCVREHVQNCSPDLCLTESPPQSCDLLSPRERGATSSAPTPGVLL
jgi:hypothetical protein